MHTPLSPIKRVLAVNDISCFGKCSLTVNIPILARFGIECVPLPTAILSTHTGDFSKPTCLDMTEEIKKIIAHWNSFGLRFDCVYTGYMPKHQLSIAKELVLSHKEKGALILVDPVMGDNGSLYSGFDADHPMKMRALSACAHVITPNLTEAMLMTGMEYKSVLSESERYVLYKKLSDIGAKNAVVTGVHPNENEVGDVVIDENGQILYEQYLPATHRRLHGCGDVFASVLCARLVNGENLTDAVRCAQTFTGRAIEITNQDKENHWYALRFESLMDEIG